MERYKLGNGLKSNLGFCVICENDTTFVEYNDWLRDHYLCVKCKSIPRHRALINALNLYVPDWKERIIHESSPCGQSAEYIKAQCKNYSESQLFKNVNSGEHLNGIRCENLEDLTFHNESFNIFITQDVFEHVLRPKLAFKEINRVLKPGGMHIFTMPWYPNLQKTEPRIEIKNNNIENIKTPVYHGNPVDGNGSLVTYDWGSDFTDFIYKYGNMYTTIYLNKDKNLGLDGEFLHVFISKKIDAND